MTSQRKKAKTRSQLHQETWNRKDSIVGTVHAMKTDPLIATEARITALLEELVTWMRFAAREPFRALLTEVLVDPRHLKAYVLTDGTRTQKEVGDASGLSQPTVSNLWQKWKRV